MKKNIAIIYGGQSAEHGISLKSAEFILKSIDQTKYTPYAIVIEKESGLWYLQPKISFPLLEVNTAPENLVSLLPDHKLYHVHTNVVSDAIDVVFPVLHGPNGEDGTLQGLLQLIGLPFVGANCLGSAVAMDKDVSKRLLRDAGISIAPFKTVRYHELETVNTTELLKGIGLPCFVKPANMGSSYGISKVNKAEDLHAAIVLAFKYDHKVLIEAAIVGREVECSVMGNDFPVVTNPCEIKVTREYYDFTAKYDDDGGTEFIVPAVMEPALQEKVKAVALKTYFCLDCRGMARVDCFLTKDGTVYINEINTIPGFTAMSMYPRMWQASGVEGPALVKKLIDYAFEAFEQQQNLLV